MFTHHPIGNKIRIIYHRTPHDSELFALLHLNRFTTRNRDPLLVEAAQRILNVLPSKGPPVVSLHPLGFPPEDPRFRRL